MHELLAFVVIVIEGIVNLVCGADNSHRQITAGECLTDGHDIRGNSCMVAGEHFAGSAEAGSNFVGNQEYAVFITELTQLLQVERRIDTHACTALDDRLNDNGSGLFGVFSKFFLSKFEAFALAMLAVFGKRATVAIRCLYMDVVHHHGFIHLCEQVHAAYGKSTDGFAMVAFAEAHEALFFRVTGLQLILEGNFQRNFYGRGAVVGKVEFIQPFGENFNQLFAQLDSRLVGEVNEDNVL